MLLLSSMYLYNRSSLQLLPLLSFCLPWIDGLLNSLFVSFLTFAILVLGWLLAWFGLGWEIDGNKSMVSISTKKKR